MFLSILLVAFVILKTTDSSKRMVTFDLDAALASPHNPPPRVFTKEELDRAEPDSFDPRQKWPNCRTLNLVHDTSSCGSAWAWAAVDSMSDRECIHKNRDVVLSAEDVNSCNDATATGCDGGYPSDAFEYFLESGVVTEECRPYSLPGCDHHIPGSANPCQDDPLPTPPCIQRCLNGRKWEDDKHFAIKAYTVSGEAQMKAELSTNGPCEASFSVYEDFLFYTSGVYKHGTGELLGGHAAKILGYGSDHGVPYWLLANVWNVTWGERGFFRFFRGQNECKIEGMMWCGMPM